MQTRAVGKMMMSLPENGRRKRSTEEGRENNLAVESFRCQGDIMNTNLLMLLF